MAASSNRLLAKWVDFSFAIIVWGVVEFVAVKVVPVFADIFKQFGGRLPPGTRLALFFNTLPGMLVVPVLMTGLVLFQVLRTVLVPPPLPGDYRVAWDHKVMFAVILFGVITFVALLVSLYLPIFTLGDQIGGN